MFKRTLLALTVLASVPSLAAGRAPAKAGKITSAPAASAAPVYESTTTMLNNIGVAISFPNSPAIGIDYERRVQSALGIGGYFKFYAKDDSATKPHNGFLALGAQASAHYDSGPWDLFISPGFGIVAVDAVGTSKNKTTFGPRLATGVLYQLTPMFALGFEHSFYYAWFDKDIGGELTTDLAVKGRFTF